MIDKQNKMTMTNSKISDLKKYVGDLINYKGMTLRISDVSHNGVTVYEPSTGRAATLSIEAAAELIRMKFVNA